VRRSLVRLAVLSLAALLVAELAAGALTGPGTHDGARAAAAQSNDPEAAAQSRAAGSPGPVRVLDGRGPDAKPCPPVDTSGPFVKGGCPARANAFSTIFTIRTVFGGMRFGDCTTDFDLTFSADGRIWFDDLRFGGTPPCNDVWPCSPRSVIDLRTDMTKGPPRDKVPPWRGRLLGRSGDGTYRGRFRLCLDTCAGRFDGDVAFTLRRTAEGWKLRASRSGLDSSSLEVDAEWNLLDDRPDFGVEPAGAR
jgi:hypothetical protein